MKTALVIILISAVIGGIAGIIMVKALNKNKKLKTEYDERQQAIRGKSYIYGLYTTWVLMLLLIILDLGEIRIPAETSLIYATVAFITILVVTVNSTLNDAYFGLNNDLSKYSVAFTALIIINGLFAIIEGYEGLLIENGMLTFKCINAEIAIVLLIERIVLAIKKTMKERGDADTEEDEDEES